MERILLCKPRMCGREIDFIRAALAEDWAVPLGPDCTAFEHELEMFVGQNKHVAALVSGTAAVHLALVACGVGPGDEVMVQSFTFCASSHPVTYLGATPVFVDSEKDSWNMDPQLLDRAIADRIARTGRKPKAIIPVALYGMPYKIDEIMAVADKYEIPVIEDAAEGFGSRFNGQTLGTFGRYGVLSFNGNKMITTSGGGALICRDAEAAREILWYATQARESYPYYQHEAIGYNYRMSNICAGIGRGQMTILEEHIAHHRRLAALYAELFAPIAGIDFHGNPDSHTDANFWLSTITVDPDLTGGLTPDRIRLHLDPLGIETRLLWKPMHLQPVYASAPAYVNGVSEHLFARGLCLPSGPWVTEDDVRMIVGHIVSLLP